MSGSFEANERALGAQIIIDTLQNMIAESPLRSFSRETILGWCGWASTALTGVEEDEADDLTALELGALAESVEGL